MNSSGSGQDHPKKNLPRIIFYQSNISGAPNPSNDEPTTYDPEHSESEPWIATSEGITTKELVRENGHEDEVPLLLEELQEETAFAVQNIDKLFKKAFGAFRQEKNEMLEQHESDKKIWISAMVKYRAEFRSFYANLVHHLRRNGYTGTMPEFPDIAIKTIVEDVRKTIKEENQATEGLAEPLRNLSVVPSVPLSVNAPAFEPSIPNNRINVEVSGNSNYTSESKYEWRWSADADDDWRN